VILFLQQMILFLQQISLIEQLVILFCSKWF
jgi:hypothetical protein